MTEKTPEFLVGPSPLVARRTVLRVAGGALLVASIDFAANPGSLPAAFSGTPTFRASILRREDLLTIDFAGYNLVRTSDSHGRNPRLVRQQAGAAYLVASLAPQSVGEQAFFGSYPGGVARAVLSGSTVLAFRLPDSTESIPYRLGDLLDWAALSLSVGENANGPGESGDSGPTTAIEAPWHLLVSPDSTATWQHAVTPVTKGTRTELWHTRLAPGKTIRALGDAGADPGFDVPLDQVNRARIVKASTTAAAVDVDKLILSPLGALMNVHGAWAQNSVPALEVSDWKHRSTLGRDQYVRVVLAGYLFPFGHRASLIELTERKVDQGAAVLFKRRFIVVRDPVRDFTREPEAKYEKNAGRGNPLRTVRLLTLVTPDLPNPVPPNIIPDPPPGSKFPYADGPKPTVFWVPSADATKHLRFAVEATDVEGRTVRFDVPMIWMDVNSARGYVFPFKDCERKPDDPPNQFCDRPSPLAYLNQIALQYQKLAYQAFYPDPKPDTVTLGAKADVTIALNGAKIAYGPPSAGRGGDTALETFNLVLSAEVAQREPDNAFKKFLADNDLPAFYPLMQGSSVRLAGPEAVAGKAVSTSSGPVDPLTGQPNVGVRMNLPQSFVDNGFDAAEGLAKGLPEPPGGWKNLGSVFLQAIDPAVPVDFSKAADKVGGVAGPSLFVTGLSRELGTFGGKVDDIVAGRFDPKTFFQANAAKLLGTLNLADILPDVPATGANFKPGQVEGVPKIVDVVTFPGGDRTKPPTANTTTVTWNPKPKSALDVFVADDGKGKDATLSLLATIVTDFAVPQNSTFSINGELRNFRIKLFGSQEFLILTFTRLRFVVDKGGKPKIDVDLAGVEFAGPLSFVNVVQQFLSTIGLPGLAIDVGPKGIDAGYTLALPNIVVGVFALQNLSLTAGLHLPFDDSPMRVRFAFCSRENPFLLTVSLFGGGGFLGVALGTDGLEMIEASLEFGGALALDIGIASGSVSVMAGIYFRLERQPGGNPPERIELTGFLRIDGHLTVLGIVTISAEFYMGLTYLDPGKAQGRATLTVSVSIACFSKSVSLTVERRLGGSGDPPFGDTISSADWRAYCGAFALEG
ncbi:hypothetical protein AB5J62_15265 [Amycolatopsis sp. cg5]|uniref:hypothetical protein n=1 Tax=Amycolatopsis sp. cg5 TaxID=3238802 RepID=UPI00352442D6